MDYEGSMDLLERMLLDPNVEPTSLPLSLLKTITNGFSDDEKIGCGGFADVYKGILQNGTVIAVKKLFPNLDMDEEKFIKEVGCLMKAKNKNIVQFLGYCSDTQGIILKYEGKMIHVEVRHRLLCFEFLPKRSLDNYITDVSEGLEWRMRYKIIKGICEGLHYLHQNRIVHLDLKPANILLTDNMVPKIADFGLARCFDGKQSKTITSKVTGSLGYLAPESHDGVITFKSDIYSLGIIIMEMLTGQKGYCDIQNVLQCWSTRFKSSQEDMWSQHVGVCAEIAKQCIDPNPVDRPGTLNIIERLDEMERTCGFIETDICASSVTKGPLAVALNSSSVKFSSFPIRDTLPGRAPLNVVIVYAFDCCDCTPAWYTVDDGVFWMVQSKLTRFTNSCLGYICFMSKGNKYTLDMKLVDSAETKATGYKEFAGRRMACRKEMASGLAKAHEMIGNQRYQNGIILLFSDGFKHALQENASLPTACPGRQRHKPSRQRLCRLQSHVAVGKEQSAKPGSAKADLPTAT